MKTHEQILNGKSQAHYFNGGTIGETRAMMNSKATRIDERPSECPGYQIYVQEMVGGKILARFYRSGQSASTLYYSFSTVERYNLYAESFWADAVRTILRKAERAQKTAIARQVGHGLEVGDILTGSWGYEQTNVDAYQIVKVTKGTVTLRRLALELKETHSSMSGTSIPIKDSFIGEPKVRRVNVSEYGVTVRADNVLLNKYTEGKLLFWSSYH